MHHFRQREKQSDAESPLSDTARLLPFEENEVLGPLSLLHYHKMLTYSVSDWYNQLKAHQAALDDWVVTKVEHMKNFHYSWVFHEYLRVTLRRRNNKVLPEEVKPQDGQKPQFNQCTIYVERGVENDQVTVGCKPHKVPKLYGWWIVRYLRGNYNDAEGRRWPMATSSSTPQLRELGYSASDFLRSLDFDEGIGLCDFAKVVQKWSCDRERYNVANANCYWFANMVYAQLKHDWNSTHREFIGGYIKHRNRFSGFRILLNSVNSASASTYSTTLILSRRVLTLVFCSRTRKDCRKLWKLWKMAKTFRN